MIEGFLYSFLHGLYVYEKGFSSFVITAPGFASQSSAITGREVRQLSAWPCVLSK